MTSKLNKYDKYVSATRGTPEIWQIVKTNPNDTFHARHPLIKPVNPAVKKRRQALKKLEAIGLLENTGRTTQPPFEDTYRLTEKALNGELKPVSYFLPLHSPLEERKKPENKNDS